MSLSIYLMNHEHENVLRAQTSIGLHSHKIKTARKTFIVVSNLIINKNLVKNEKKKRLKGLAAISG